MSFDETDSQGLGRLVRARSIREVWTDEATSFTPWLAGNLDVLAQEVGFPLSLTATEVSVGGFRLDIQAEDDHGRVVAIENQLERTDHTHLGQTLVYTAGLDASAVIWIASEFRPEHRLVFEWLNDRTDIGTGFFAVEVSVVTIGQSPPAPFFEVVAAPNQVQKAAHAAANAPSELNEQRQDFFEAVLRRVSAESPRIRQPKRSTGNWSAFSSGPFGNWAIVHNRNGEIQIEAYIDLGDKDTNERLFGEFEQERARWEAAIGITLDWQKLEDSRACRIAALRPVDLDSAESLHAVEDWAVSTLVNMHEHLDEPLREAGTRCRRLAQ